MTTPAKPLTDYNLTDGVETLPPPPEWWERLGFDADPAVEGEAVTAAPRIRRPRFNLPNIDLPGGSGYLSARGLWNDPGSGEFQPLGWSTAKARSVNDDGPWRGVMEAAQRAGKVRARVADNRMSRAGIRKGDVIEVEYKSPDVAVVRVKQANGRMRPYDVQWTRFDALDDADVPDLTPPKPKPKPPSKARPKGVDEARVAELAPPGFEWRHNFQEVRRERQGNRNRWVDEQSSTHYADWTDDDGNRWHVAVFVEAEVGRRGTPETPELDLDAAERGPTRPYKPRIAEAQWLVTMNDEPMDGMAGEFDNLGDTGYFGVRLQGPEDVAAVAMRRAIFDVRSRQRDQYRATKSAMVERDLAADRDGVDAPEWLTDDDRDALTRLFRRMRAFVDDLAEDVSADDSYQRARRITPFGVRDDGPRNLWGAVGNNRGYIGAMLRADPEDRDPDAMRYLAMLRRQFVETADTYELARDGKLRVWRQSSRVDGTNRAGVYGAGRGGTEMGTSGVKSWTFDRMNANTWGPVPFVEDVDLDRMIGRFGTIDAEVLVADDPELVAEIDAFLPAPDVPDVPDVPDRPIDRARAILADAGVDAEAFDFDRSALEADSVARRRLSDQLNMALREDSNPNDELRFGETFDALFPLTVASDDPELTAAADDLGWVPENRWADLRNDVTAYARIQGFDLDDPNLTETTTGQMAFRALLQYQMDKWLIESGLTSSQAGSRRPALRTIVNEEPMGEPGNRTPLGELMDYVMRPVSDLDEDALNDRDRTRLAAVIEAGEVLRADYAETVEVARADIEANAEVELRESRAERLAQRLAEVDEVTGQLDAIAGDVNPRLILAAMKKDGKRPTYGNPPAWPETVPLRTEGGFLHVGEWDDPATGLRYRLSADYAKGSGNVTGWALQARAIDADPLATTQPERIAAERDGLPVYWAPVAGLTRGPKLKKAGLQASKLSFDLDKANKDVAKLRTLVEGDPGVAVPAARDWVLEHLDDAVDDLLLSNPRGTQPWDDMNLTPPSPDELKAAIRNAMMSGEAGLDDIFGRAAEFAGQLDLGVYFTLERRRRLRTEDVVLSVGPRLGKTKSIQSSAPTGRANITRTPDDAPVMQHLKFLAALDSEGSEARKLVHQRVKEARADWARRNLGTGTAPVFSADSNEPLRERIENVVSAFLPARMVDGLPVLKVKAGGSRGFYRRGTSITVPKSVGDGTALHEYAHHVEQNDVNLQRFAWAFYRSRTDGERSKWIGDGYGRDEKGRADEFYDKYAGKDYGMATYRRAPGTNELFTMGMEGVFTSATRPSSGDGIDAEYAAWVLGTLATFAGDPGDWALPPVDADGNPVELSDAAGEAATAPGGAL